MPLQNRVTPFGDIIATPERGMFVGNRGCLCDSERVLARRRWRVRAWITCQLSYKDWWRPVMQPGVWTELFFMDEATALAAGHRPCALCRRAEYNRFREAWAKTNNLAESPKAAEMDYELHTNRVDRNRQKITYAAGLNDLPDGTMVSLGNGDEAYLLQNNRLHKWSASGYGSGIGLPSGDVTVLTPKPTVDVLAAGYEPLLHPSLKPNPD